MISLQDLRFIPKTFLFLQSPVLIPSSNPKPQQISSQNTPHFPKPSATHLQKSCKLDIPPEKIHSFLSLPGAHLKKLAPLTSLFFTPPSFAVETEQVSDKINIESILVSIDDFFNRYPFFVAGCTVIWLVVIPLTQEYLKKCKFISAIDAFRKLSDLPNSQLLDIRKKQSVDFLNSPNLKVLNKSVVQIGFVEGQEEGFVKEILSRFGDPGNTVLCVLDCFDGNSMKVAELLFENGFKEAYAIKGGLRGKDGWQAIQETLLPPSVHVYPRKKKGKASVVSKESKDGINVNSFGNGKSPPSSNIKQEDSQHSENGRTEHMGMSSEPTLGSVKSLSPYPKYSDLKPPTSPTPSEPKLDAKSE